MPGVSLKRSAVRIGYVAVHTHDSSVFGTPRQDNEGRGVGVKKQVGMRFVAEAVYCRGVYGNAVFKGTRQFFVHNGYVFLLAKHVAKG